MGGGPYAANLQIGMGGDVDEAVAFAMRGLDALQVGMAAIGAALADALSDFLEVRMQGHGEGLAAGNGRGGHHPK